MRILILGNFNGGNWGDMACLTGLVTECRRKWPKCTILVRTRNAAHVARWVSGVEAVPPELFGLGVDDTALDVLGIDVVVLTAGLYNLPAWITLWPPVRTAHGQGRTVLGVNAGCVPPTSDALRRLMRDWLRSHDRISTRDEASAAAITALAPDLAVQAFADCAHLVVPTLEPQASEYVGLNIATAVRKRAAAMYAAAQTIAASLALPIRLVQSAAADGELTADLAQRWKLETVRLQELGLDAGAQAINAAAAVVATRLHAVLLATALCVPTIAVAYEPKVQSYMTSIGMDDLIVPPTKTLTAVMPAAMQHLLGEGKAVRATLAGMNEKRAVLARQGFEWATEGL